MKERPILFSAPMVQAILAGNKTQTRRIVKPQPYVDANGNACWNGRCFGQDFNGPLFKALASPYPCSKTKRVICPFGKPGDQLYAKETWGVVSYEMDSGGDLHDWTPDRPAKAINEMPFGSGYYSGHVIYRADGEFEFTDLDSGEANSQWKPSIHMPRTASRIQLEITGIRIERLQDCSEADALAEGVEHCGHLAETWSDYSPVEQYSMLWSAINGMQSWHDNPWVWVIEFKVIDAKGGA